MMESLGLLCGHLVGDYIFQDDYQAANKTSSSWVCALHCTLYTLAVWLFSWWYLPWWSFVLCWLAHFPVDRWRLARKFMSWRHEKFATGILTPWSVILVDNTFHLVVLFFLGVSGRS